MRKNLLILLLVIFSVCQTYAQCDDINFDCNNFDLVVDLAVDTAGLLNLCEGEPITFLNQTTDNLDAIDSFVWIFNYLGADLVGQDCEIATSTAPITHIYNFDDSLICTNPNVDFVLLSVGLSAIDTNGCFSLVQSNEIVINILPRALFQVNESICTNTNPDIVNLSCPNSANIEFEWESQPDGQFSTEDTPDFTYPNPGTYTITLTAISDTCNFQDTYIQEITVLDPPDPGFIIGNASADSLCAGIDTLVLIDQSFNTDTSYWQINPGFNVTYIDGVRGGDTVMVIFEEEGTYNLILNSGNQACTRDTIFSIEVLQVAFLNVNNLPDCVDTSVIDLTTYTNFNGTPDSYTITVTYLEDGSEQVFTDVIPINVDLSGFGAYEVEIISQTECGQVRRAGLFGYFPNISIDPVQDLCANQDTIINLNTLISPLTSVCLEWSGNGVFDDSLFNPITVGEGVFNLTLQDCENLCINESLQITVLGTSLNLDDLAICITNDAIFLDDILAGQWSGIPVSNDSLNPILSGVGTFEVYYQSDPASYCNIYDTILVEVKDSLIVDFSVNAPNCVDSTFNFINQSSANAINWDFDDGFFSNLENPSHQYISTGEYNVQLIVGDPLNGCVDSVSKIIIVQGQPQADFTVITDSAGCDSVRLTFVANQQDSAATYTWDINGDTILFGDSVSYIAEVFDTISQIQVDLMVANTCGSANSNQLINVPQGFFVDLIYDSEAIKCAGDSVDFIMISNNVDSFIIDYGNGIISINEVIDLPFDNSSDSIIDYLVTIYGYSESCGWDTAEVVVPIIKDVPVAAALFSNDEICVGETVSFYNNSQFENEAVVFFGDSNAGIFTSDTIDYQYNNAGTYNPYVVAYGCGIDTNFLDPIMVSPIPILTIEIEPNEPCIGDEIVMSAEGNNISPVWLLNDDTAAIFVDTFIFIPTIPGDYEVILFATAPGNSFCTATDTVVISVGQSVDLTVDVFPNRGCAPLTVDLLANSIDSTTNYQIDFGNQQVSQNNVATTIYNNAGTFTINVEASNNGGCLEDTTIQVEVFEPYNVQATEDVSILIGESVELDFEVNQDFEEFTWYLYDTLIGINTVRPLIEYPTEDAIYWVEVSGIDSSCSAVDSVLVKVECDELFVPDAFSPNNDGVNDRFNIYKVFSEYRENVSTSCVEFIDVSIFDRWGELIFYSDSIDNYWDGTYKDKVLNAGIFTGIVNYKRGQITETIKKEIHLIK